MAQTRSRANHAKNSSTLSLQDGAKTGLDDGTARRHSTRPEAARKPSRRRRCRSRGELPRCPRSGVFHRPRRRCFATRRRRPRIFSWAAVWRLASSGRPEWLLSAADEAFGRTRANPWTRGQERFRTRDPLRQFETIESGPGIFPLSGSLERGCLNARSTSDDSLAPWVAASQPSVEKRESGYVA